MELAGEPVLLLADRALCWPREATLFLADPHFGKGTAFRRSGIAVPDDTGEELERLTGLITSHQARRLVVLGDLLHARAGATERLHADLARWRAAHPSLEVILIRGNHDLRAGDPRPTFVDRVVSGPATIGPFDCCHEPRQTPGRHVLAGHLHPGFALSGRTGHSLRSPCFWLRPGLAVLPAFGAFTGLSMVDVEPGDRIILADVGQVREINPMRQPLRRG
ncbi:MAG TPA: DEAD/DEAH box helicase [Verrucomicrobiales bacterium]|nr:DEAD/DEAH box helicase [Verrucomicrobiales bacterium]